MKVGVEVDVEYLVLAPAATVGRLHGPAQVAAQPVGDHSALVVRMQLCVVFQIIST